jgi:hypothetical protein
MKFVDVGGNREIEQAVKCRRPRRPRLDIYRERIATRDRGILLLHTKGKMSVTEICEFLVSLSPDKPALSQSQVYRIIQAYEAERALRNAVMRGEPRDLADMLSE